MAAGVSLLRCRNAEQECKALTLGLESQLYWDIIKIYSESLFCDVEIQFESSSIKTHSCFLLLYAPRFYAELGKLKESRNLVFLDKAKDHVETFIRALYQPPKSCLKEKEAKLVERLRFLLKTSGDESQDLYLTPESDIIVSNECESDNDRSHLVPSYFSTNQLYYALITLDESFLQSDSGVEHLEKELEEQDQLSESLRSLKGNRGEKRESKFSESALSSFKNNTQASNQKNFLKKGSKNKFRRFRQKSKNDEMSDSSEKVCKKDCCFGEVMNRSTLKELSQFNTSPNAGQTNSETSGIGSSELVAFSNDHDSDNSSSIFNERTNHNENNDGSTRNGLSTHPFHQTSTSHFINAPNESGSVTGGYSAFVSDYKTFVIDTNGKAVCSDNDVSVVSNSNKKVVKINIDAVEPEINVESTDKNFPVGGGGMEMKNEENAKFAKSELNWRIMSSSDRGSSTAASNSSRMSASVYNNVSTSVCSSNHGKGSSSPWPNLKMSNSALVESCSVLDAFDIRPWIKASRAEEMENTREQKTFVLKNFSEEISKKINKMEQQTVKQPSRDQSQNSKNLNAALPDSLAIGKRELVSIYDDSLEASQKCSPDSTDKFLKNETCAPSKNNFFIDASSLLDETEFSLPLNSLSLNNNQIESNSNQRSGSNSNQICESNCNQTSESNQNKSETNLIIKSANLESEQGSVDEQQNFADQPTLTEMPRLIRQKTFELEPNHEKLELLRQEYEKQQGDKIFQTSYEGQNGNVCDDDSAAHEINQEDSKSGPPPYCYNHEVVVLNSPDSLNNDDQPLNEENCSRKEFVEDSLNTNFVSGKVGKPEEEVVINCTSEISGTITPHLSLNSVWTREVNQCSDSENNSFVSRKSEHSKMNSLESIPIVSGGGSKMNSFESNPIVSGGGSKMNSLESIPIVSGGGSKMNSFESNPIVSGRGSKMNSLESIPIVSGGIGVRDISNLMSLSHSSNASPSMSRKVESSPILSSGAVSMESEPKIRKKRMNPVNSESWIIDLSDVSKSSNTSRFDDSEDASTPPRSAKSSSSGSSFFIDLNELSKEQDGVISSSPKCRNQLKFVKNSRKEFQKVLSVEKTKVDQNQQTRSCGFFVNLNDEPSPSAQSHTSKESNDNLFTMFIDFNNPSSMSNSLEQPPKAAIIKKRLQTQAEKFSLKQNSKSDSRIHSDSDYEHPEVAKGKHLFNEFSPASSRAPSVSHPKCTKPEFLPDNQSDSFASSSLTKRLSETSITSRVRSAPVKHKRTHSISIDKIQQQINRIPDFDKFTSNIEKSACSGPASLNLSYGKSKMTASWHGTNETHPENSDINTKLATVDDFQDLKSEKPEEPLSISNYTDISNNSTSISEMGNSKHTFILDDEDIVRNPQLTYDLDTSATSNASDLSKDDNSSSDLSKTETNVKSSSEGVEKVAVSKRGLATSHVRADDSFVKLSDMDKEPLKNLSNTRKAGANRMSRSIPEVSWIESRLQSKSATSRSLNRLFPQLSASINSRTSDYSDTDLSTISSMHSSMEPSVLESTEDSEQETKNCSQLGEDLLRMFLDEISPDVIVEVGGRRIKAHKCILSSRCQYFAAILSGGWVQSAGDVISLQGFSYNVVHFALCHIYSGVNNIPDSISIVELATLADMLCLEGLKEVISYTLKLKYCHFFHKPCSICTVGVLECLTLAAAYGLDDLYRKCLRWINKYFTKLWVTKPFASFPRELIEKSFKQLVAHITVDSILDTFLNCKTFSDNIPSSRWAETLHDLAKRLNDACIKYTAQHFSAVISSNKFTVLFKDSSVDRTFLEPYILRAAELLSPDESCKSYGAINKLVSLNRSQDDILNVYFVEFLNEIYSKVEEVIVRLARRAVKTMSWTMLDIELRTKIQKRACLVFIPGADKSRIRPANNRHESASSRTMELHKVKLVINGDSEELANTKTNPSSNCRPKTWPSQNFAQVKSRYLEQRPGRSNTRPTVSNVPEKKSTPLLQRRPMKSQPNKISSSDSSRTQSPALSRPLNSRTINSKSSQSTPLSRRKDIPSVDSVELSKPKPLSSRKSSLTHTKTLNANVNSTRTQNMRVAARNAAAKKNGVTPKTPTNLSDKKTVAQSPMPSRKTASRPNNANNSNAENKSPLKQRGKLQSAKTDKATASGLTVRRSNFTNNDNKVQKGVNASKPTQTKANVTKPDKHGSLHSSSRSGTFCKDEPSNVC